MEQLRRYIIDLDVGVEVGDEDLLLQSFTHKSFAADDPGENIPFNERLEFLGDSILGAVVAEKLFDRYPELPESKLTLMKIWLVKEKTLALVARKIELGSYLRLGNGEERSGGRDKDAVLSDGLEALIAYLYLDHGAQTVASFIEKYIMRELDLTDEIVGKSRKSKLQEYIQKQWKILPEYEDTAHEVEPSGNVLMYQTIIRLHEKQLAIAYGPSKKKAQEAAAQKAYAQLTQ